MRTLILKRSHGMGWRRLALALALLVWAQFPAGGQTSPSQQTNAERDKTTPLAPRMVTDEVGRHVEIPQPVRRIVSLAPNVTEMIYALGAESRLVGDSDACDYPPDAQKKTKVGGPFTPNLEQIVALKPDLVLIAANSGNRRETADALDLLHIPTYATNAFTIEDILKSIVDLGDVIGATEQARTVTASMRAKMDQLRTKLADTKPAHVLFVIWQEPLISIGRNTFLADALRLAGAESIIDTRQDWPHVNMEEVVHLQPEYLVFAPDHSSEMATHLAALRSTPGWRDLKAVQENRVAVVSDAINRPAPRLIDAVVELARQLHPEAFANAPCGGGASHANGKAR
ncbi:MAG TPA: cobalamin-binding protein [Candidatus Limnocylindrales bacterium]|nr:cobalamin-binding protein [Candidatus Limnocylindrales bacterium]